VAQARAVAAALGCALAPAFVAAAFLFRRTPLLFRKFVRRRLFEIFHECQQIAGGLKTRDERVDMVRHHAISRDPEFISDGLSA
jgi:hypothetical protein